MGMARCTLLGVNILYGINTVTEALKARGRNFEWVAVAKERKDIRLKRAIDECRKIGVPVRVLSRMELDEIAGNAAHQGLVAATSAKQYSDLDDLVASRRGERSLIVVLDGVEDPHNLGAILRTADAAGADGVVIPERRSAAVTGAVAKVSAGASEHLPVAKVTNISRALEELKEKDLWIVGLDERGEQTYDAVDYKMHCAVVLGAEGKGLHDLVRRHCDFLVSIPMLGKVPSLNVSVAAGVVLYEVVRQRRLGASKRIMKFLCVSLSSVVGLASAAWRLEREAFTITKYDLEIRLEPEQQRLGARGKITLRNDSAHPQKIVALQISSSLNWRSIRVDGKAVQFVSQPYTSDIDHTGALSEAIVTLPAEIKPKDSVEIEIGYEGVIPLDATRLTRVGVPEEIAKHSSWDQISPSFTAVRGAGYVAWYPITTESADFSEGNSLFEVVDRWKAREAGSEFKP